MRMRIAYQTADEVNFSLAGRMARQCGGTLVPEPSEDVAPPDMLVLQLHDLDHVPGQQRQAILADLLSRPATAPVAVHSYNLGENQVAALRARGVIVARSLDTELVHRLLQAIRTKPEPHPIDGDPVDAADMLGPATLCARVRSLASQAHHLLTRTPSAPIEEIDELRQQLADLQQQLDGLRRLHAFRFDELTRWLESLRDWVRDRSLEASA